VKLLQLLEDAVKRDRIGGDGAGVRACGEFRKCAGACALLEDFDLVRIHRGAGDEDVVVAGEPVHPGGAVDGRLRRRDDRRLRKIERVAAGRVTAGRGDCAGDVDALAIIPGIDERKCECQVAPLGG